MDAEGVNFDRADVNHKDWATLTLALSSYNIKTAIEDFKAIALVEAASNE